MTVIYGIKTCDTCRKALKALPNAELYDIRANAIPGEILERAISEFGENLVNKRSTTWRGLSESDRAEPVAALIGAHPTVMKRPLIAQEDQLYLGWTTQVQAALGTG